VKGIKVISFYVGYKVGHLQENGRVSESYSKIKLSVSSPGLKINK
jgi:hypothetical protein